VRARPLCVMSENLRRAGSETGSVFRKLVGDGLYLVEREIE
jgi:hypothetical protein